MHMNPLGRRGLPERDGARRLAAALDAGAGSWRCALARRDGHAAASGRTA